MIPYFLSAGVHLRRDLTAAREALASRYPAVEFRLGPAPRAASRAQCAMVAARIGELAGAGTRTDLAPDRGMA